jgi:hypothetical protein
MNPFVVTWLTFLGCPSRLAMNRSRRRSIIFPYKWGLLSCKVGSPEGNKIDKELILVVGEIKFYWSVHQEEGGRGVEADACGNKTHYPQVVVLIREGGNVGFSEAFYLYIEFW